MDAPVLFRKRLIPNECIRLDQDRVLASTDDWLITAWDTIRPKKTLKRGVSAYFWKEGVKISKFYDHNEVLLYWYCDIIDPHYYPDTNSCIITDLLADVLVYPDGHVEVLDLDELADAFDQVLITPVQLSLCLRRLSWLLDSISSGRFADLQLIIEKEEKKLS